jgi:hypothetical protein
VCSLGNDYRGFKGLLQCIALAALRAGTQTNDPPRSRGLRGWSGGGVRLKPKRDKFALTVSDARNLRQVCRFPDADDAEIYAVKFRNLRRELHNHNAGKRGFLPTF